MTLSLPFSRSRYFAGPAAAVGLLRRSVPLIRRAPSADQLVPLRATGEWSERSEANTRTGTEYTQREARSYAASRVYR